VFAYRMDAPGDVVVVAVNRADGTNTVSGIPDGDWVDALSGATFSGPEVDVPGRSTLVLTPQ